MLEQDIVFFLFSWTMFNRFHGGKIYSYYYKTRKHKSCNT